MFGKIKTYLMETPDLPARIGLGMAGIFLGVNCSRGDIWLALHCLLFMVLMCIIIDWLNYTKFVFHQAKLMHDQEMARLGMMDEAYKKMANMLDEQRVQKPEAPAAPTIQ